MVPTKATRQKYNLLTKYHAIVDIESGVETQTSTARRLNCSPSVINDWMKSEQRDKIVKAYEEDAVRSTKCRLRPTKYEKINQALYEWYMTACASGVPVDAPMTCSQAKKVAARLALYQPEFESFAANSSWLARFKTE